MTDIQDRLREEFSEYSTKDMPDDALTVDSYSSTPDKTFAGYLSAYVMDVLNETVGPCNWVFDCEFLDVIDSGKFYSVVTRGTLKVGEWKEGEFVTEGQHTAEGSSVNSNKGNALKAARTDSFKKAASMFGFGVDAYKGKASDRYEEIQKEDKEIRPEYPSPQNSNQNQKQVSPKDQGLSSRHSAPPSSSQSSGQSSDKSSQAPSTVNEVKQAVSEKNEDEKEAVVEEIESMDSIIGEKEYGRVVAEMLENASEKANIELPGSFSEWNIKHLKAFLEKLRVNIKDVLIEEIEVMNDVVEDGTLKSIKESAGVDGGRKLSTCEYEIVAAIKSEMEDAIESQTTNGDNDGDE